MTRVAVEMHKRCQVRFVHLCSSPAPDSDISSLAIESSPEAAHRQDLRAPQMRDESRSQFAFFDASDFLRLIGKSITVMFKDRYTRSLVKQATASNPKEFMEFLGYGLFVGRKCN